MNREAIFFVSAMFAEKPPTFPTALVESGEECGWAHLPKIILFYLLKYLNLRTAPLLLRSVCPSWRSSLPLSEIPKLPLGFDAPKLPSSLSHSPHLPLLLFYTRLFLISPSSESTHPWLVRVSDVTPHLGHNTFQLKSVVDDGVKFFDTNPPVSGGFNALDFNILEVSSCFSLLGGCPNLFNTELNCLSRKIVGRWDFTSLNLLSLLVRIRADDRGRDGLGFLKLGHENWININEMKGVTYDDKIILNNFDVGDIVFYDGEFYAFDLSTWKIGVFDPSDFDFDDVPCVDFFDGPNMAHFVINNGVRFGTVDGVVYAIKGIYFVPSRDGLYLIFEMSGYDSEVGVRLKLIVFELDEDEWKWNRVWSIGENVFFIGVDVAFSINADNLPLWKPGSICLFTGQGLIGDGPVEVGRAEMPSGLDELRYPKYWKKFRVYNMEEEEKGILGFDELSTDVYMRLFFPPPKWVKWTCPGSGDVEIDLSNLKLCDGDGGGNDAKFGAMVLEEVE